MSENPPHMARRRVFRGGTGQTNPLGVAQRVGLHVAPSDPLTYRPTMFKKLPKMMKNRYGNNHVKVGFLSPSIIIDVEIMIVPLVDCIYIKSFERYRGRNRCMYRNNEVQSGWIKSVVLTHLHLHCTHLDTYAMIGTNPLIHVAPNHILCELGCFDQLLIPPHVSKPRHTKHAQK